MVSMVEEPTVQPSLVNNANNDSATRYQLEYNYLTEKIVSGKEATDLMCDFWEKLAYIEYQYAKSIAQLCHSRYGRLQKMFSSNDKTLEYFRPLQSVWGAVIEDLVTHSESHLNVAYTLQREVKPALARFSAEELSKQVEVANHGKKVITGLKDEQAKLLMHRKKLYKTLLTDGKVDNSNHGNSGNPGIEEGKEALPSEEPTTNVTMATNETESTASYETKALQRLWIRTKDSHAHTYNVTIPSILEELNNVSVKRVEEVCNSVGHFTTLVTSANTPFKTTASTLLAAQTAVQTIRYDMKTSPPPTPDLEKPMTRDEMTEFCQTPAKKFFNNIQGMFATSQGIQGMFNMNKQQEGGAGGPVLLGPQSPTDNPLKDISQKVSNLLTTLRTRTLSGHLVESPHHDDELLNDDRMLDADSDDSKILDTDPSVVQPAQIRELPDGDESPVTMVTHTAPVEPEAVLVDVEPPVTMVTLDQVEEKSKLVEKDMVLALSPDTEDYVVVEENKTEQ